MKFSLSLSLETCLLALECDILLALMLQLESLGLTIITDESIILELPLRCISISLFFALLCILFKSLLFDARLEYLLRLVLLC